MTRKINNNNKAECSSQGHKCIKTKIIPGLMSDWNYLRLDTFMTMRGTFPPGFEKISPIIPKTIAPRKISLKIWVHFSPALSKLLFLPSEDGSTLKGNNLTREKQNDKAECSSEGHKCI